MKEDFVNFYKALMGTTAPNLPAVNRLVMRNGPCLSHSQYLELCVLIIEEEIYDGLCSIEMIRLQKLMVSMLSFPKGHGLLSSRLKFVKQWRIFFIIGTLYKAINCTTITLVPKVPNPNRVKDYRHIACCTVSYKIIAKIITSRLHKVMAHIILEAYARFISGRRVSSNCSMTLGKSC